MRKLVVVLGLFMLLVLPSCDSGDPECLDRMSRADCESDPECEAQVAWLVVNGFAGPLASCDMERFVQCLPVTDLPVSNHAGIAPDMPGWCWITRSASPLPSDWTACAGLDHLDVNCR